LFNPVYDNGPDQWGSSRVGDDFAKYSPAHHITSDDPPTMVVLGTRDRLIPVWVAERFHRKLENAGVHSELYLYEDQPHGFFNHSKSDGVYYRLTTDRMLEFLASLGWFNNETAKE
jgi:acetyl esterase/lipase